MNSKIPGTSTWYSTIHSGSDIKSHQGAFSLYITVMGSTIEKNSSALVSKWKKSHDSQHKKKKKFSFLIFFQLMKKCHPPLLLHPLHMTAADASSFSYSDSLLRVELTEIYWKQWVPRKSEQNEDLSIFSFNFQTVVLLLPRDQPSEKSRPSRGECSVLASRVQHWRIHTVYNTYFENDIWSLAKLRTSSNCCAFFFYYEGQIARVEEK